MVKMPGPPLLSCKGPQGCRCIVTYVQKEESGATDTADFIRSAGGAANRDQLQSYLDAKLAPMREKGEKDHLASQRASDARDLEKDEPEQSVCLYRESIAIRTEIAHKWPDRWSWRDIPSLYNRLTLLLERLRQYDAALQEIARYETLPCQGQGTKSGREAIQKRKARLQGKSS